jgi:cytochrome oxidase Cu insertion factor (SCO1/SenC/PrrC family)
MNRAWLWIAAVAALAFVGLSIALRTQVASTAPATGRTALPLGAAVVRQAPEIALEDAAGRAASLGSRRGAWVVLAPATTRCRGACPLTTGRLLALRSRLRAGAAARRTAIVTVSVDPWGDTPRRIRAFRRAAGTGLPLWTGRPGRVRRFWRFFGVHLQHAPQGPEDGGGLFLIGPRGYERVAIPARWTVEGVVSDLRLLSGARGPDPSRLRPQTRGASGLVTGAARLSARLRSLRGRSVVLNARAPWCPPCREELPLFAEAARRLTRGAAFLGADVGDDGTRALVRTIAPVRSVPTTIFLAPSGRALHEHLGAYRSLRALLGDIRRYAPAAPAVASSR